MGEKKKKINKGEEKNVLEWIVFASSLLLILSIFGYLAYKSYVYQPSSPVLLVVYTPDPSPIAEYRYKVVVKNTGHQTAEEVQLELVLEKDGKTLETAGMQLPFAPQQSTREGWVNFSKNPAMADTLYVRVISYKKS